MTYALPGEKPRANLSSDCVAVNSPFSYLLSLSAVYTPRFEPSFLCSLTSKSKGLIT